MLGLESKINTYTAIKGNLILFCRNFLAFVVAAMN